MSSTRHHITRAGAGARCWCGATAVVTRTAPGVESHYCGRHWQLWWNVALSDRDPASVAVTVALSARHSAGKAQAPRANGVLDVWRPFAPH